MKDVEKSDLPLAVHTQDRGGIIFINPRLIPFVRYCITEVHRLMTYQEYSEHGKGFFKVNMHAVTATAICVRSRQCTQKLHVQWNLQ